VIPVQYEVIDCENPVTISNVLPIVGIKKAIRIIFINFFSKSISLAANRTAKNIAKGKISLETSFIFDPHITLNDAYDKKSKMLSSANPNLRKKPLSMTAITIAYEKPIAKTIAYETPVAIGMLKKAVDRMGLIAQNISKKITIIDP
jgi:hypothetical protein